MSPQLHHSKLHFLSFIDFFIVKVFIQCVDLVDQFFFIQTPIIHWHLYSRYVEDNPERVARYINGLRFEIQDQMNLLFPNYIKEAYQFSLQAEEKIARNIQGKSKGSFRGQGLTTGRGNPMEESSSSQLEQTSKCSKDRG